MSVTGLVTVWAALAAIAPTVLVTLVATGMAGLVRTAGCEPLAGGWTDWAAAWTTPPTAEAAGEAGTWAAWVMSDAVLATAAGTLATGALATGALAAGVAWAGMLVAALLLFAVWLAGAG